QHDAEKYARVFAAGYAQMGIDRPAIVIKLQMFFAAFRDYQHDSRFFDVLYGNFDTFAESGIRRHRQHALSAEGGYNRQQEPESPNRPPVKQGGMTDDAD